MQQVDRPPQRFPALDGLRGLFALAVVLFHCPVLGHFYDWPLVRSSYLAVDFFFVLSGFVITHASSHRLDSGRALAAFVVRRFGRVWPLHVFMLLCMVALEGLKWLSVLRGAQVSDPPFATAHLNPYAIPAHLVLMHALHLFPASTWNIPSWSISAEFYTYFLFALCTLFFRRVMTSLSLLLCIASGLLLWSVVPTMNTAHDFGFVRCVLGFFMGHLVYRVFIAAPRRGLSRGVMSGLELALLGLVCAFTIRAGQTRVSIAAPLLFALAVWCFAHEGGALSGALRTRPLQWLGELSYALYMVHEFVFLLARRALRTGGRMLHLDPFTDHVRASDGSVQTLLSFGNAWWMDALALGLIACSVALAYLAHRAIELPAQAYFQRLSRRYEQASPILTQAHPAHPGAAQRST